MRNRHMSNLSFYHHFDTRRSALLNDNMHMARPGDDHAIWHAPVCCFTQFSILSFTVHATLQLRTHWSRSPPPVRVAPTSQGRIHQSGSHPPVKAAHTSQSRIHQSRSHPLVKVAPAKQGRTHQSRSICDVACTVAVTTQISLPCRAQYKQEPAT